MGRRRETGSLNGIGFLLVDRLDEADELLARLISHLLVDAVDVCEDLEEGVDVGHEGSAVCLEEMKDRAEDGPVLKKVVAGRGR